MKKLLLFISLYLLSQIPAQSQGCVAIRSTGSTCSKLHAESGKEWRMGLSYRYFRSFRHFVGTVEQKERLEKNTEVINWQHAMNIEITRQFNSRWSLGIYIPVINNVRSSLYEHGGNSAGATARHKTRSFGLGDLRVAVYKWLLNPSKSMKANIQAGLGLKFPTGDYKVQDYFIKSTGPVLGPVDQSIQLGDGGTGFTTEVNAFYNFSARVGVYGNFYYLFNPREQNGVLTSRGETPSASSIAYGSSVMSVPDQYMARIGANYSLKHITFSAGLRHECVPSDDIIGGSSGFRRPGYVTSIEPGISYEFKKASAYISGPVAIWRNRTRSYADKKRTDITGTFAHGDAAFADYSINVGVSFKL